MGHHHNNHKIIEEVHQRRLGIEAARKKGEKINFNKEARMKATRGNLIHVLMNQKQK